MYLGFARISPAPLPTSCSKSLLSLCWARVILLIGLLAFAHYPHYSFTYNQGKFLKKYKSGHVTLHKVIHWLCIAWKIKFKPTSVACKILYAWAALHLLPSSWTIMLQLHWLLFLFFFLMPEHTKLFGTSGRPLHFTVDRKLVSLPSCQIYILKPNPQCDGIWGWDLWVVIRS